MTLLAIGVRIADAAQVHRADAMLHQPVDGLFGLVLIEVPEACEVVHHAVGNHAEGNLLADGLFLHHQTVHGIVQCRVATHDDDGLVAIGDHHLDETFHTVGCLTLYHIVLHPALVENLFYLLPTLAGAAYYSRSGTIQDAPPCRLYCHNVFILSIFSSIGRVASIQCI